MKPGVRLFLAVITTLSAVSGSCSSCRAERYPAPNIVRQVVLGEVEEEQRHQVVTFYTAVLCRSLSLAHR